MKRVIALLLVVIVSALIFSGCEYTLTTDLSSIMTEINEEYSYDNMNILKTKDELNQFYLVEKDDVASFAAEFSTASPKFESAFASSYSSFPTSKPKSASL